MIRKRVLEEDKIRCQVSNPLNRLENAVFKNETGVYAVIFGPKLERAKKFKEVLPSNRMTEFYQLPRPTGKQVVLLNEMDLCYKVVNYIRKYHKKCCLMGLIRRTPGYEREEHQSLQNRLSQQST